MLLAGLLLSLGIHSWSEIRDEPFPARPIRIVIPYQPGGGSDLSVRLMKDYLAKEFGVPIVFENMAGARGTIGTVSALRADPDGYTVLYGADGIVTGPLSLPKPAYDLFRDLLPICHYGFLPIAYGVRANSRFKTIEELVAAAKAAPGRLSWGITNFGGMSHLSVELFKKDARIDAKIVPLFAKTSFARAP